MSTEYATQLEGKLKQLALTPAGISWVMKALHPVTPGAVQMPDPIQVCALAPEYKTSNVINAPPGLAPGGNWDAIIVSPPGDRTAFMWSTGAAGIDFALSIGLAGGAVMHSGSADHTVAARGLGFDNVTGAPLPIGQWYTQYSVEQPACWRTVARSTTVYATGSALYNQGTVYSAQYARKASPAIGNAVSRAVGFGGLLNFDQVALPLQEADMAAMTPGFYTGPAEQGVYSVHRLTGPAQAFTQPRQITSWRDVGGVGTYYSMQDAGNFNYQCLHWPRFLTDNQSVLTQVFPAISSYGDSGYDDNCTWGVTIFRGLHPQMSLTVKTVCNLELVPCSEAPSRQFVKPPARYDPQAIAAYYAIASEVPCCMASKHNFFGTILPVLSQVASRVLPYLAPAAGQLLSSLGSSLAAPRPAPAPERRVVVAAPRRASSASSRVSRVSSRAPKRKVKAAKRRTRR